MAKLNREHLRFIDNYLENSNIIHADIRMEMVDHIASNIETIIEANDSSDFYDLFKNYMIANKSKLLDNNKQFLKSADRKIFREILKQTGSFSTIVFLLHALANFYYINQFFGYETFRLLFLFAPFLSFLGFGTLYLVRTKYYNLKRFSVVERLAFPFLIFYLLFIFIYALTQGKMGDIEVLGIILISSIAMTIFFVLVMTTLRFTNVYSKRFKVSV